LICRPKQQGLYQKKLTSVASYQGLSQFGNKKWGSPFSFFFSYKSSKLKLMVFLAGHIAGNMLSNDWADL